MSAMVTQVYFEVLHRKMTFDVLDRLESMKEMESIAIPLDNSTLFLSWPPPRMPMTTTFPPWKSTMLVMRCFVTASRFFCGGGGFVGKKGQHFGRCVWSCRKSTRHISHAPPVVCPRRSIISPLSVIYSPRWELCMCWRIPFSEPILMLHPCGHARTPFRTILKRETMLARSET